MMTKFKLKFEQSQMTRWAGEYAVKEDEVVIERVITPRVLKLGYLERQPFLDVCKWKTPRTRRHCEENNSEFIREATELALGTAGEQMRIMSLTLLKGVNWPTASVFLHWFHREPYPILDVRALWTLGCEEPPSTYDFNFWWEYTQCCRRFAQEANVSMRDLDRALWNYSKAKQDRL